jgi:uncharacterized protein (UPF0335 family)
MNTIEINPSVNTSVTVWNDTTKAGIAADIKSGRGCRKEIAVWVKAQVGGKAWLSTQRATRKTDLIATSGAIMGQLSGEGFKITRMTEIRTQKTGNRTTSLTLTQFAETAAEKLEQENAQLRAEINKLMAAAKK